MAELREPAGVVRFQPEGDFLGTKQDRVLVQDGIGVELSRLDFPEVADRGDAATSLAPVQAAGGVDLIPPDGRPGMRLPVAVFDFANVLEVLVDVLAVPSTGKMKKAKGNKQKLSVCAFNYLIKKIPKKPCNIASLISSFARTNGDTS